MPEVGDSSAQFVTVASESEVIGEMESQRDLPLDAIPKRKLAQLAKGRKSPASHV
jgi:hypothetical protein